MKVTEIGASVSREIDTGYAPYMRYLESLGGRSPAFGTREQSKAQVTLWAKATIEGDDPNAAIEFLVAAVDAKVVEALSAMFPESFIEQVNPDEMTYREVKTATNPTGGPEEW
ncbi:MAG TPA: hypothetical protein PKD55_01560 [Bellilinea sp.]|nr:hypothetical protein [Bellilinea sp.]